MNPRRRRLVKQQRWESYVAEKNAQKAKLEAKKRAKELDPIPYLERLNTFFEQVKNVKSWKQ